MTRRSLLAIAATLLGVVREHGLVRATPFTAEDGVRGFQRALDAYMALRQRLEHHIPALRMSDSAEEIRVTVEARRLAIRSARAHAQCGDMFNADVAALFRMRIQQILLADANLVDELLHEMQEDGAPSKAAVVNGEFSWSTAAATPPSILLALPTLPDELQYRFVGRDLVLIDVDASVVLDILPGIIRTPPARRRRPVTRGHRDAHVGGEGTTAEPVALERRGRSSP